ncbi:MAG TPA: hypothetical protein VMU95_26455 [Trebonia sp.]|nr:hypothetical protein [Trebonia sp.]
MSEPPEQPDVEIRASVKARELTFNKPPRTHVETCAELSGESGSANSCRNLPDQVETGVPYQDVEADFTAGAKLNETEARAQGQVTDSVILERQCDLGRDGTAVGL